MAGLVPASHVLIRAKLQDVDARHKGRDAREFNVPRPLFRSHAVC
jgi:hypothetical protein